MEEATIGAWLKNPGDSVHVGDSLCELVTEKTTLPLEAENAGVLKQVLAPEKSIVPVGFVIGILADEDEDISALAAQVETENAALREGKNAQSQGESQMPALQIPSVNLPAPGAAPGAANSGSRLRATPAARRLAKELNLDIEAIAARNPGKVLSEDDIRKSAE